MQSAQQMQKLLSSQRQKFEELVKRKFIYVQTAEIYGGVAGLYDYGPIGAGIKNNVISRWKKHFIVEEDLLEISCTTLTPQIVLKHSGHEDRFADWMVKDPLTKETFRADHLIEDAIETRLADAKIAEADRERLQVIRREMPNWQKAEQFDAHIAELNITNPTVKKNKLSGAYPFNLMFDCKIGPLGDQKAYLRPETAQSIFVNFKRLLEFRNGKLPFGGAIVGLAYRNEIAPRNGLLRVREFEMAEIEYFIDPLSKDHPRFHTVSHLELPLWGRKLQETGEDPKAVSLKEACATGLIANEMLGYFIGRTYLFAREIGLNDQLIRFRQHQSGEMAHYACDCWDMEVLCSYGWVECVGLADRSAYDLTAHSKGSGDKLVASRVFEEPVPKQFVSFDIDRALIGKTFKQQAKAAVDKLEDFGTEELLKIKQQIEADGKVTIGGLEFTDQILKNFKIDTRNVQEEKFTPSVIEPSFGIGRLIYCALEHSFRSRDDEKRTFFVFKPSMAPYKVVFLPLMAKPKLMEVIDQLEQDFRKSGIMCKSDSGSNAIGKRYARTDEMGIPFGVTIDFQTLEDQTATLRDIASMKQIRVPLADLKRLIAGAVEGETDFAALQKTYPSVEVKEDEEA